MTAPALIGLDWGTSTLRGYLLDREGSVLAREERPEGILKVEGGDFEAAFEQIVGPWRQHGDLPVLASGMIGSRQGWHEAPYVTCPAGAAELAKALLPVPNRLGARLWLVPGMSRIDPDGVPDVMRGEETQLVGAIEGDGIAVLPGTHSKWARVEAGRVTWFATFMTGEMFAVLAEHSILGRMMEGEALDDAAFARGLAYGADGDARKGGLLRRLFSARSLPLLGELPPAGVRGYVSGLLIGVEIREARACLAEALAGTPVTVIGGSVLASRYAQALAAQGLSATVRGEEATTQGLVRIAAGAGLLG